MKSNVRKEKNLLRVGILGCGVICQAAHLISASKASNVTLEAICDVSQELRDKMAAIYEPRKVYDEYEKMLEDPEIDAVIIGNGDQFHVPCSKQAIRAGKHVLIEKALGVSIEAAKELQELIEETDLVVQIGNMKRFDGGLQYAKEFVEQKIGEVTTFKGWYCDSMGRYQITDNVMPVLYSSDEMKKPEGDPKRMKEKYYLLGHASHLFDTARFFMGDIISVQAQFVNKDEMYSWLIACEFSNGTIGNLNLVVSIAQDWHEGVEILGTEGTVYAKTFNPWEMRSSVVECCERKTSNITTPFVADGDFYRRQLEGFADTILNHAPQKGATAKDGIEAIKAIVATYQSVHSGGTKVYIKDVTGEM